MAARAIREASPPMARKSRKQSPGPKAAPAERTEVDLLADYLVDLAITGGDDSIFPEKASVDDIAGCANFLVDLAMAGAGEESLLEEDPINDIAGCANFLVDLAMAGAGEDSFLEEDPVDDIAGCARYLVDLALAGDLPTILEEQEDEPEELVSYPPGYTDNFVDFAEEASGDTSGEEETVDSEALFAEFLAEDVIAGWDGTLIEEEEYPWIEDEDVWMKEGEWTVKMLPDGTSRIVCEDVV